MGAEPFDDADINRINVGWNYMVKIQRLIRIPTILL